MPSQSYNELDQTKAGATGPAPGSTSRAGLAFNTIAELAAAIEALCREAQTNLTSEPNTSDSLITAASSIASQIGLIADIGAHSQGALMLRSTQPVDWLLPTWNEATPSQEVQHA